MQQLGKEMDALSKQLSREMEELYPLPPEPQKPVDPRRPVSTPFSSPYMSAVSIANQGIRDAIAETPRDMTTLAAITDIIPNCPAAADLTNQRVSALVQQLVSESAAERLDEKRENYFRAV